MGPRAARQGHVQRYVHVDEDIVDGNLIYGITPGVKHINDREQNLSELDGRFTKAVGINPLRVDQCVENIVAVDGGEAHRVCEYSWLASRYDRGMMCEVEVRALHVHSQSSPRSEQVIRTN